MIYRIKRRQDKEGKILLISKMLVSCLNMIYRIKRKQDKEAKISVHLKNASKLSEHDFQD